MRRVKGADQPVPVLMANLQYPEIRGRKKRKKQQKNLAVTKALKRRVINSSYECAFFFFFSLLSFFCIHTTKASFLWQQTDFGQDQLVLCAQAGGLQEEHEQLDPVH